MIIVLMGVAGSGKTTVGQLLADRLQCTFLDADSLHSKANVEKMSRGIPLTDADRAPWLAAIHSQLVEAFKRDIHLVVACSALKEKYRQTLADGVEITWVYLKGSEELIRERLKERSHHFMKAGMLASQFAALEEPTNAIIVQITDPPETAVGRILSGIAAARANPETAA